MIMMIMMIMMIDDDDDDDDDEGKSSHEGIFWFHTFGRVHDPVMKMSDSSISGLHRTREMAIGVLGWTPFW